MITFHGPIEIFVCHEPTDMRRSFDRLSSMVQEILHLNPLSGNLFIFFSKRKTMMKILFWDRTGFVQYYKRLENGTFSIPVQCEGESSYVTLHVEDLKLLCDGINVF